MQSLERWRLGGGLVAASALIGSLVFPAHTELQLRPARLPADGRAVAQARVVSTNLWGARVQGMLHPEGPVHLSAAAGLGLVPIPTEGGGLQIRAGTQPGTASLSARGLQAELRLLPSPEDADGDGLPDAAERRSQRARAAVTAWFTAIAEAQFTRLDDGWARVHQDCAGLVRFALREALKRHDPAWFSRRAYLPPGALPDPGPPYYPELPFIGELPFRKTGGRFDPRRPLGEQLTAAAGARALWQHNSRFISRDLRQAKAGDLLFYRVPYGHGSRMHTMILLGQRPGAGHTEAAQRVVYHTGGDGEAAGEVRLLKLAQLFTHPDPGWHPSPDNPRFLGVHRLSMLTQDSARPHARLAFRGNP